MKVVVQRVKRASVSGKTKTNVIFFYFLIFIFLFLIVANELVGKIDAGLCLLVGITHDDTEKDLQEL